jgi:hypothetical protein
MLSMDAQRLKVLLAMSLCASFAGCAAVKVTPVNPSHRIEHICIQENRKVQVDEFVVVMQEGFQKHGITSELISGLIPKDCVYSASYIALRSWEGRVYFSQAQIDLQRDGQTIASASLDLKNGSSRARDRKADIRTKMIPIIDTLLGQPPLRGQSIQTTVKSPLPIPGRGPERDKKPGDLASRLSALKDALDAQLISPAEYEVKRKALIESL